MKRKLSTLERLIDGNIAFIVGVEGSIAPACLRRALAAVQRKHPALRMLMREEAGVPVYEMDAAPEIPLRVVDRTSDADCSREALVEVAAPFGPGQPQLRVVWMRSEERHELVVTAAHRICDGMGVLIVVRELLRGLCGEERLVAYPPVTVQDVIAGSAGKGMWRQRLAAGAVNALFALLPSSRRPLENRAFYLQWQADEALSAALVQRCRDERVSMHSALLMALCEALGSTLGRRAPDRIESPVDARRGRLPALKADMLFFGGGSFRIAARRDAGSDFWAAARELNREIRLKIDRDIAEIPQKYRFCEMIRSPSPGKLRSIVRLGDAVSRNANWNLFSFSNLGNVVLLDGDAPLRVTSLRLYVHSFSARILGIIAHALDGKLQFLYVGDEKCLDRAGAEALRDAFMAVLEKRVGERTASVPEIRALDAATG
ncbi:condensation domain-containing protein [Luteimonas salinilitoris]|uniref:Condensation domain-containing protein n=1 Tax=Luteimonas salinilitoris TaxID=3237697 RepID=A0ABV4HQ56_9GAMM